MSFHVQKWPDITNGWSDIRSKNEAKKKEGWKKKGKKEKKLKGKRKVKSTKQKEWKGGDRR